jgi:hypothetical protein
VKRDEKEVEAGRYGNRRWLGAKAGRLRADGRGP